MNWDAIGAISDGLAALAVIVTLLYLARQLKDHAKAMKLQSLNSTFDEWNAQLRDIQLSPPLAVAFRKAQKNEPLTDEESHQMTWFLRRAFNLFAKLYFLSSMGATDEFNQESMLRAQQYLLRMNFFHQWWPQYRDRYAEAFQADIDRKIRDAPNKAMESGP